MMPIADVRARNDALRAAGLLPGAKGAARPARATTPLPLIRPPCTHLGARLPGQPCGSPLLACALHKDVTTRFIACKEAQRCCATCPDYAPGH